MTSEHHLGVHESFRFLSLVLPLYIFIGPDRVLIYGYTTISGVYRVNWESGISFICWEEEVHYD